MTKLISFSTVFLSVRKAIFFFVFALSSISALSQNLVPNPSFEVYDTCPADLGHIENAVGWRSILNTPDCFNSCSSGRVDIPMNQFGFQNLKLLNENAYAGLITSINQNGLYSEIIGIELNQPLIPGKKYYLNFDFSSGYNKNGQVNCRCFVSNLGVKFLTSLPDTNNISQLLIDNRATLFSDSILKDTANWITFSGNFVADSAYSFILIGNFFNQTYFQIQCDDSLSTMSYTYIDNVCLSPQQNGCGEYKYTYQDCNFVIVPNPAVDKIIIQDFRSMTDSYSIKIYNSIGKLILSKSMKGGGQIIDLSNFQKGLYLISINNCIYKIILI